MLRPSTAAATGLVVPLWCPLARARPRAGIGVAAVPRGGASAAQGRHHRRHVSIAAGSRPYPLPDPPAPLVPSLAQNLGDYSTWDRLQLVDRELELAVCDEKYPTAARLRDERALLLAELPAARVLLLRHLTALKEADHSGQGSAKRMRAAIAALSSLADRAALPALFALLGDGRPEVAEAARSAMAAIRAANTPNTRACALAQRGSALLLALGCGSLRLGGGGERQEESTSDGGAPCIATAISSGAGGSTRASIEVHEAAAAALELFTDAITLDPSLAGAHMGRGCLLYRLGGYEQAAVDLETAVNLDPYHWPAMRLLALARGQLRQWHAARQALASAAVRCPGLVQQDEYRATEAVLQQWEAANAAWRARFEAARDAALLEEGKRQLEEVVQASGSQGGGEAAAAGHGEAAPDHVPRPRPEEEVDGLGI